MYFNESRTPAFGFGQAPAPSRTQAPRCRSIVFPIPGSYGELEHAVKVWISTCVTSRELSHGRPMHREVELVTNNPSLRSIWSNILQHRVGQSTEIRAEYVWGQFKVESIRFSTPAQPPAPAPAPTPVRPPQPPVIRNLPPPRPYTGPTIGPAPPDPTPRENRDCGDIGCDALEYLKEHWGITPSESTVRNAISREQGFLRRTKYRARYRAIIPETLLFQSIDDWGLEFQRATMELNQQVEREARERVFTTLFKADPTYSLGGRATVQEYVNSRWAR